MNTAGKRIGCRGLGIQSSPNQTDIQYHEKTNKQKNKPTTCVTLVFTSSEKTKDFLAVQTATSTLN